MYKLIDKLYNEEILNKEELKLLLNENNSDVSDYLYKTADKKRKEIYENKIFIRGLIEISNYCKNDCYYCGINVTNKNCKRYRLNKEEILSICKKGYSLGFRTFVLQGGEDKYFSDEILTDIIKEIKSLYPTCAITLSLGERTYNSYLKLYNAGADRYLLRHETINKEHYYKLHSDKLSYENRIECLNNLKKAGYQVGCGFMIGSPYQTIENIIDDILFIKQFNPQMVGVGPFIPHQNTIFKNFKQGDLNLTLKILSIIRLMNSNVLLPATTALATINGQGRNSGIKAGCNVIMPNLAPNNDYELYNNKLNSGLENACELEKLKKEMKNIGYEIVVDRGDYKN